MLVGRRKRSTSGLLAIHLQRPILDLCAGLHRGLELVNRVTRTRGSLRLLFISLVAGPRVTLSVAAVFRGSCFLRPCFLLLHGSETQKRSTMEGHAGVGLSQGH